MKIITCLKKLNDRMIKRAADAAQQLKADMDRDLLHALSWSSDLFRLAADAEVATGVQHRIAELEKERATDKVIFNKLRTEMSDMVLRRARGGERSTSAAKQAAIQAKTEALAAYLMDNLSGRFE